MMMDGWMDESDDDVCRCCRQMRSEQDHTRQRMGKQERDRERKKEKEGISLV